MPWALIIEIVWAIVKWVSSMVVGWNKFSDEEKEAKKKHLKELIGTVKKLSKKNAEDVIKNEKDFEASLAAAMKLRYAKYKKYIKKALDGNRSVYDIQEMAIGEYLRGNVEARTILVSSKSNEQQSIDLSRLILF